MSKTNSSSRLPACIYDRVSSYKQIGGRFTSCEAQATVCDEFIRQRAADGWYLEDHFSDPAYSGKNLERPGMRAMKEAIAAGRIKMVVAYKIERLLRTTDEWPEFRRFLKQHNCQFATVSEGFAEDTAAGRFRTNMMVAQSAYERENTGEKVRNTAYLRAQRGFWRGGYDAFGYNNDKEKKQLRINDREKLVVRKIYEQVAALVPLTEIANQLNADGVRTRVRTLKGRDGKIRQAGGIRIRTDWLRMLVRNPIYRGIVVARGEEFKGQHETIVDADLWDAANAVIRRTLQPARSNQPRRDRHFNVLKGLVVCGECRRAMVPHASGKLDLHGKPYRFYTCNGVLKERGDARCRVRHVSGPALELCVVSILGQMARRPEVVAATLAAGRTDNEGQKKGWENALRHANSELSQITQQLGNLIEALAKSGLKALSDQIRQRTEQLSSRKDELLIERERLQQELQTLRQEHLAPAQISAALGRFDDLWSKMTAEEQRELVNLAIAGVEVRAGGDAADVNGVARCRSLDLCLKLHLPELLAAGGGSLGKRKVKLLSVEASVQVPVNGAGDVSITAPFKHRVTTTVRRKPQAAIGHGQVHPIHRALQLEKCLRLDPRLSLRALAVREKIAPATLCQWRKLTQLCPEVQQALLAIKDRATAWRCSIRRVLPLVSLPPVRQWREFQRLTGRRRNAIN